MKTPPQVLTDIERRLTRTWHHHVTGTPHWPHTFPLGQPTRTELTDAFPATARLVSTWRDWAHHHNVTLTWRTRKVHGTTQQLPTHVHIPDIDTAATLSGDPWPDTLTRARTRNTHLRTLYPHLDDPARLLRQVTALTDVDFDLLCTAADWFATHDATGLTPRQVPIPGLHAKWLNTRQALVRELANVPTLRLLDRHPSRIHFTYLDPTYLTGPRRRHDSATVGDTVTLPYPPQVIVISENKDTAVTFPPTPGGISIEGVGRGGHTIASFPWITNAPHVLYWGDMDADGLEILNEFRAAGIPAHSILMDLPTYTTWQRFGTNTDATGRPLTHREPRPVTHLTPPEQELYALLTGTHCPGPRRIEQERIPLDVAHTAVLNALT